MITDNIWTGKREQLLHWMMVELDNYLGYVFGYGSYVSGCLATCVAKLAAIATA